MEVIRTTRAEMENILAELRIKGSLKSRFPPATKFDVNPGQDFRVYRERRRRWEGPFNISRMLGKQVWVPDGMKTKHLSCTQVLSDPADVAGRELAQLLKGFQYFNTCEIPGICVTVVVHPAIPINNDPEFNNSKSK